MNVEIRPFAESFADETARLVAAFRVELAAFKGVTKLPDLKTAREELEHYISSKFPIFIAISSAKNVIGYLVCRYVPKECVVWAESLYVREEFRRMYVGSLLYAEAERLAANTGNDTVYNWVHPNNDTIINFLAKRGYNVLNLVEVRRLHHGEPRGCRIVVGSHEFEY